MHRLFCGCALLVLLTLCGCRQGGDKTSGYTVADISRCASDLAQSLADSGGKRSDDVRDKAFRLFSLLQKYQKMPKQCKFVRRLGSAEARDAAKDALESIIRKNERLLNPGSVVEVRLETDAAPPVLNRPDRFYMLEGVVVEEKRVTVSYDKRTKRRKEKVEWVPGHSFNLLVDGEGRVLHRVEMRCTHLEDKSPGPAGADMLALD